MPGSVSPPRHGALSGAAEDGRAGELRWLRTLIAAALLGLALSTFVAGVVRVHGHSMEPTLHDGEIALVVRAGAYLHRVGVGAFATGDVVFFPDPTAHPRGLARLLGRPLLIKRIVAGPSTTVGIRGGTLYVDGGPRQEAYLGSAPRGDATVAPEAVPAGSVFVIGDNRRPLASFDSRSFGPVRATDLRGRAVLVLWPLLRRGADGWHWNVRRLRAAASTAGGPAAPTAP